METTPTIQAIADDIGKDVSIVKDLIGAYKTGGKSALLAYLPGMVPTLQKEFEDVKAALPEIKAGYKTTEFWLTAGVLLGNTVYTAATGKTLPIDLNVTAAALVGVYALVRSLVKKPAAVVAPAPIAAAK